MTLKEFRQLGAKARWKGTTEKERSDFMKRAVRQRKFRPVKDVVK